MEKTVLGGGCFWCTEAIFKELNGVTKVLPGYAGGHTSNPTYQEVADGKTGHAEVVSVKYDESKISFHNLLVVFFSTHDPTTLNRQGNDVGTQYRSVIFFTSENQKIEAEKFISEINISDTDGTPIITEVVPLDKFYEAENYHKDYYENNKNAPYCQIIINPKLDKLKKQFSHILKSHEK